MYPFCKTTRIRSIRNSVNQVSTAMTIFDAGFLYLLSWINESLLFCFLPQTDLHDLQIGFHSVDFSPKRRLVLNTNYLQLFCLFLDARSFISLILIFTWFSNWFSFHRLLSREETSLKYQLSPIVLSLHHKQNCVPF